MNRILIALFALLPLSVTAEPFPKGDATTGKKLHDAKCVACHKRLVGGDGSDIFACTPRSLGSTTACTWAMYWDGSANGFSGEDTDSLSAIQ